MGIDAERPGPGCDTSPQLQNQRFNHTCGLDLVSIHEKASNNIGRLQTPDVSSGGTAFKVCNDNNQCNWVTANHNLNGSSLPFLKLRTADGVVHDFTVVDRDQKNDIAVLRVKGEQQPTLERPGLKLLPSLDLIHNGDPIVGAGYGALLDHLMYSPGRVTDPNFIVPKNDKRFAAPGQSCVKADAQLVAGQSGGPALDRDGKVAAMVSSGEPGEICYSSVNKIDSALKRALKK